MDLVVGAAGVSFVDRASGDLIHTVDVAGVDPSVLRESLLTVSGFAIVHVWTESASGVLEHTVAPWTTAHHAISSRDGGGFVVAPTGHHRAGSGPGRDRQVDEVVHDGCEFEVLRGVHRCNPRSLQWRSVLLGDDAPDDHRRRDAFPPASLQHRFSGHVARNACVPKPAP